MAATTRRLEKRTSINTNKQNRYNCAVEISKAAAWAWYMHGTGKPSKNQESNARLRLSQGKGKPSRFMLEFHGKNDKNIKTVVEETPSQKEGFSSLLDPYEILVVSKQLEESGVCSDSSTRRRKKTVYHPEDPNGDVLVVSKLVFNASKQPKGNGVKGTEHRKNQQNIVAVKDMKKAMWSLSAPAMCGKGPVVEPVSKKAMELVKSKRGSKSSSSSSSSSLSLQNFKAQKNKSNGHHRHDFALIPRHSL